MTTTTTAPTEVEAPARHDVTDRRANNMQKVLDALAGCVADLNTYPGNVGVSYTVGDRLARLMIELETFRARDLINQREAAKR